VRTGFQCQVSHCATRLVACSTQRIDFGVRFAGTLVPAFSDNLAVFDQHAAHHRVRVSRVDAALGEAQGARHECAFRGRKFSHRALPVLLAQQLGQQ
jgi:hypothetical protein